MRAIGFSGQAVLGLATIAIGTGNKELITKWKRLALPRLVRENAGLASMLPSVVHHYIRSEIEKLLTGWRSPAWQRSVQRQRLSSKIPGFLGGNARMRQRLMDFVNSTCE